MISDYKISVVGLGYVGLPMYSGSKIGPFDMKK